MTILKRIVATSENCTEQDFPKGPKISAILNPDNVKPGEKIQLDNGGWAIR